MPLPPSGFVFSQLLQATFPLHALHAVLVHPPHSFLFHVALCVWSRSEGDLGEEMFFVSEGKVEFSVEASGRVFDDAKAGAMFGETALIMDEGLRKRLHVSACRSSPSLTFVVGDCLLFTYCILHPTVFRALSSLHTYHTRTRTPHVYRTEANLHLPSGTGTATCINDVNMLVLSKEDLFRVCSWQTVSIFVPLC